MAENRNCCQENSREPREQRESRESRSTQSRDCVCIDTNRVMDSCRDKDYTP